MLIRSFAAWHRQSHQQDHHLIDQYFDGAAFDAEVASLPGKYRPPHGQLLLATLGDEPVGCVALRRIDAQYCEMKRMFVPVHLHSRGIGLALGQAIVASARTMGFKAMRLDTSIRQVKAQALYKRIGFRSIEPYYQMPQELRQWLVFMELPLERSPENDVAGRVD
jgi:GNAT superfamily N-acetyltransferase